ncbi:TPA: hypothetical protein DDW69_00975 [candidate division CPR2 bacterium]|uniref:Glycosyltransferase RgtA/B/C/D-like domain-containing protein n=1 Tax=candidate division CPR2 bacterium GW2011_GWC1_41_48 TaxID=1618344 RepID=A0A0G0W9D1_UNCC2|nr:MAG: hypothetical protein UT47_C0007G0009 [candidate division CPR2 bacterium GW2011_GWC2_39_35]KKR27718.1 MAG: hypothetical protein UT59_C0046G0003 [candidate division CPR2 bacterium GW2011_GWD1_39_7]KKR28756.1 MAG: hypothetical protein UT60_C0013G0023 [candidate division CPR2 bacterium GW2011_GWD2_39_7]KKS08657.1 MAG: hypothetical protein UU65_C0006G0027 [candidate division CPR2 bacterium GW2011_GWC1_41_48]OGB59784.1 MAG: hypothetical protein A2Y27_00130 [candidate division CPR2 bacterium G
MVVSKVKNKNNSLFVFFWIVLAFVILFPVAKLASLNTSHFKESRNHYKKIEPLTTLASSPSLKGEEFELPEVTDDTLDVSWEKRYQNINIDVNTVNITYPQNTHIDRIIVRMNKGFANNFNIEAFTNNHWEKIDDISNNHQSYYVGYFNHLETSKVRLNLRDNASTKNPIDLLSYDVESKNSYLITAFNLIFKQQRSFGAYFFYSIIFIFTFLISGALIFKPFRKHFNKESHIIFSFAMGIIFWAFLGILLTLLPKSLLNQNFIVPMFVLWMFVALKYSRIKEILETIEKDKVIYLASTLFFLFIIVWTYIYDTLPKHTLQPFDIVYEDTGTYFSGIENMYSSDSIFPYVVTKGFNYNISELKGEWDGYILSTNIKGRPHFAPFITLSLSRVFGDRFFIFETIIMTTISLLILSVFYLIRSLFNRRVAYLATAFTMLNYYFFYVYRLTQIKLIATFFILLFFYAISEFKSTNNRNYLYIASIFGFAAVLTHNFMIAYLLAGIFYLAPNPKSWFYKKDIILASFGLPILAFMVWTLLTFNNGGGELMKMVTVGSYDVGNKLFASEPGSTLIKNINARYLNFLGLFELNPYPQYWPSRETVGFYKVTLVGAISIFLTPLFAFGILSSRKLKKADVIIGLILIPFVFSILSHSFPSLYGVHLYIVPSIPIILAFAAVFVDKLSSISKILITGLAFSEWLFATFIYYPGDITNKLLQYVNLNPHKCLLLFTALIITLACSLYLCLTEATKQDRKFSEPYPNSK